MAGRELAGGEREQSVGSLSPSGGAQAPLALEP
jgi:hypothetical protein